jgi:hypothetical protein
MRECQSDRGFLWSFQHGSRLLGSLPTPTGHMEPPNDAPEEVGNHSFVCPWSHVSNNRHTSKIVYVLNLANSTAAINLGRLIQTFKCPPNVDFSYCAMDSSILVLAEMTGGILLACVPTFGPLFFPDRKNVSSNRYQNGDSSLVTIGSKPTKRKKTVGNTLMDSLFTSKAETEYEADELEDVLHTRAADMGSQSQRTLSRTS